MKESHTISWIGILVICRYLMSLWNIGKISGSLLISRNHWFISTHRSTVYSFRLNCYDGYFITISYCIFQDLIIYMF